MKRINKYLPENHLPSHRVLATMQLSSGQQHCRNIGAKYPNMGEKWIDKMHCSFNSYRKISMKPTNKCRINKTGEFFKNNPMF